jgi:hypothetical protein
VLPQIFKKDILLQSIRCVLTFKKDNTISDILPLDDFVQIYEPALSHNDIMAIAEEFVRTHPKEIIIFASTQKDTKELAKKFESPH